VHYYLAPGYSGAPKLSSKINYLSRLVSSDALSSAQLRLLCFGSLSPDGDKLNVDMNGR
jgi:hypothetical protein